MGILDIVKDEMPAKDFENSSIIIVPKPGFCVKLKSKKNEKVFVNICISDKVPAPRRITEDELREILDDIENSPPFKVPMCIGEPHAEVDSAQKGCTAYDVAINPEFYEKVKSSELFEAFLMTVIFEGLENKYGIDLEKSWIVLKNKKCMGRLQEQCIRTSSRPAIIEMDSSASCNPKVIELPDPPVKGDTPKYELVQVNYDNSEKLRYLIARISLPKLVSSKGLDLQVGYDLLQLTSHGGIYSLELTLDKPVDEETTVAEFNRDTKDNW
uniref:PIH1 domain-containing protein 1 n=1 Tax=Trichobilharzia regenti TaxID=157069 RepID=A0AA85J9G9_TRIRE|nr:unnamed protein product [Trichobilharzia regenti]